MNGVLRRVLLVTRREWNQRARTRAFRISTLISIGIVVVLIMAPEIAWGRRREQADGRPRGRELGAAPGGPAGLG